MKITRAIKLANECIDKEIRRIAVDANLHDTYGAEYPHAVNSSKKRKLLEEVKICLSEWTNQPSLLP